MLRILGTNTRTARIAAAGATLATAAGLALVFTPPTANAAAPKVSSWEINGAKSGIHTSKGHKVEVNIGAGKDIYGGARLHVPDPRMKAPAMATGSVSLYVNINDAKESHSWYFPVPTAAVTLSSSGKGKISPNPTKTAPYAKVALKATPKGKAKTSSCKGTPLYKTQKVTLSGTFWLDTRSGKHGWGTVGSKSKKFTFSTSATVTWYYNGDSSACNHYVTPCYSSKNWSAYGTSVSMYGDTKSVSGSRYAQLSKPKGATRSDYKTAAVKSATFTQNTANKTAKFVIKGNGSGSTGSATINGTDGGSYSMSCGKAGKHLSSSSWVAKLTNGSTPFKVHDIYGPMGVKNGAGASISTNKVTN